ncbi:NADH:flavin oxidoreductase [Pontibacillus halophilus JSM 076056 = DSM 19796]|uniref:NADH:flavin oxidoreductase n=1 Tax=Pontibacillus halophilus JSM 076056 = DSM 19796 TaxID=1385510 RepID=A0A0A5GKZ8_9BACI|nr:NADH:flavin oxidoreductase [Pontibacillus halophilus]KGX92659.1 NADH:flavin oxidoreductase [Pontibacillus halophilus JSM 076056 = DSM 19796]
MSQVDVLFSNKEMGNITPHNRYVVAPMTRVSAEADGRANERMERYYERYAKGGFGTIITEGIYTDEAHSQGYNNQPGIATKAHVEAWKPIVRTVQEYGTRMIAQLMHAGAQMQGNAYSNTAIAPSSVQPKGEQLGFYGGSGPFPQPEEMSPEQIHSVIASFAHAARAAKEAGFDGVEIHGANGYLLDQYLTDYMNQRSDEYGGSTEEQLTIIEEVIASVREAVGEDFVVGIRLSQAKVSDGQYKWPNGEAKAQTIFSTLGESALDYIHITEPDGLAPAFEEGSGTLSKLAKEYGKLPVIANGKLGAPERAVQSIEQEGADFVALGTSALANPDAPNLIQNGKELREFDFENIMLPEANIKDSELDLDIQ